MRWGPVPETARLPGFCGNLYTKQILSSLGFNKSQYLDNRSPGDVKTVKTIPTPEWLPFRIYVPFWLSSRLCATLVFAFLYFIGWWWFFCVLIFLWLLPVEIFLWHLTPQHSGLRSHWLGFYIISLHLFLVSWFIRPATFFLCCVKVFFVFFTK